MAAGQPWVRASPPEPALEAQGSCGKGKLRLFVAPSPWADRRVRDGKDGSEQVVVAEAADLASSRCKHGALHLEQGDPANSIVGLAGTGLMGRSAGQQLTAETTACFKEVTDALLCFSTVARLLLLVQLIWCAVARVIQRGKVPCGESRPLKSPQAFSIQDWHWLILVHSCKCASTISGMLCAGGAQRCEAPAR